MKRLAVTAVTLLVLNPGWLLAAASSKSSQSKAAKAVKDQINLDIKVLKDQVKALRVQEQEAVDRIYAAYDPALAAQDVSEKKRQEQADSLRKERAAQLDKIESQHRESLAKKTKTLGQLKSQRDKLAAQKQAELAEAANCAVTVDVIRNTFDPQIEALDAKLRSAERDLTKVRTQIEAEKTKAKAALDPKIEDLEKPQSEVRREVAALIRQRNADVRKARAPYTSKIQALELKVQTLESAKPTKK